jgi:uncharacterized protein
MLLSNMDIQRLEKQGFKSEFFARVDDSGYVTLRNRKGHCVFYKPQEHACVVYAVRPAGCRVYPVILDEVRGIVVDNICIARDSVSGREKVLRGKVVVELLDVVDAEAEKRRGLAEK